MAVVVHFVGAAREYDVEPSDVSTKDGVLTIHKGEGRLAQFAPGAWLGWEKVASSKILVPKPSTVAQA